MLLLLFTKNLQQDALLIDAMNAHRSSIAGCQLQLLDKDVGNYKKHLNEMEQAKVSITTRLQETDANFAQMFAAQRDCIKKVKDILNKVKGLKNKTDNSYRAD